jgi:uncharacterized protein (DUF362 family)
MTAKPANPVVLVRRCEEYDAAAIERLVAAGMERFGYRPAGKVFVKPNVVFAGDPKVFGRTAYTDPALVGACLRVLAREPGVARVTVGENSAIGFPTRHCFRHAGYFDEVERVARAARCPVDLVCMEEEPRDTVAVNGVVHRSLRLARSLARADTKVYLPKLKCHCVRKMTGAVKLNIGICCADDRAVRHDFMLDEKIVDLLAVGWPDLVVMDAIDVGVGNEAFPTPRRLGLVLMGTNPLAVDLVGARLLGLAVDDVPYLAAAVRRGYGPARVEEVVLEGDLTSLAALDEQARRVLPYDDEFHAWQDVQHELDRLGAPMRLVWGPHRRGAGERCETGCVMAIKMFLASYEKYAGPAAFATAKPVVFVVGRPAEVVDGRGAEVFLIGTCAQAARTVNAKKVVPVDHCFTTASDLTFAIGTRLGMPAPSRDAKMVGGLVRDFARAGVGKLFSRRLLQDLGRRGGHEQGD